MAKSILLVKNVGDFPRLREALEARRAFVSAAPPYLIESSADFAELETDDMPPFQVLHDPPSEDELAGLPPGIRLAARAYLAPATHPATAEGVGWDAPGYEAPGRPGPKD